jgi:transglutaminase-like putative cysteine protease
LDPARRRAFVAAFAAVLVTTTTLTSFADRGPTLHEPIGEDPREDVALSVSLDGELPAALDTRSGLVTAPDPTKLDDTKRAPYAPGPSGPGGAPDSTFSPDRNTKKPDALPYDEPFRPSTAPFKRLSAYDAVDESFVLYVRGPKLTQLSRDTGPVVPATEETFFADLVVDIVPGHPSRIPSVGPGTRIVKSRAGVGTEDVPVRISKDSAENWFVEGTTMSRVRLVMQLAIARAAFGGTFGDPSWDRLPYVPPLPPNVARAQANVAKALGVGRQLSPHDNVTRLVAYFRSFQDSDESPPPVHDIYTDLALSKKGVCRHRAFAFLITALGMGIPTRMIANEAHAWVEVHDGTRFVRIDLGGAGNMLRDPQSSNVPFEAPPDPFSWPVGATRGDDLASRPPPSDPRNPSPNGPSQGGPKAPSSADPKGPPGDSPAPQGSSSKSSSGGDPSSSSSQGGMSKEGGSTKAPNLDDARPKATVDLSLPQKSASRGGKLVAEGVVKADGEPCPRVTVEIVLREKQGHETIVGHLATDDHGKYGGSLTLPRALPVGDYDLVARTPGDARCGQGASK